MGSQCYLPSDTSEHTPPSLQPYRLVLLSICLHSLFTAEVYKLPTIDIPSTQIKEPNSRQPKHSSLCTRDVNFVFFQKSIIVLKKSIFFRLSNLGVPISLCRGLLCYVPCATTCRPSHVGGRPHVPCVRSLISAPHCLVVNFSASN